MFQGLGIKKEFYSYYRGRDPSQDRSIGSISATIGGGRSEKFKIWVMLFMNDPLELRE